MAAKRTDDAASNQAVQTEGTDEANSVLHK